MNTRYIVGMGSCGIAAGARLVYEKLQSLCSTAGFGVDQTSCVGLCFKEPLVEVETSGRRYLYGDVNEEVAAILFQHHLHSAEPLPQWLVLSETAYIETVGRSFLDGQVKIALRNCGQINPERISEYEARGGYSALRQIATKALQPSEVVNEVIASGLRGRGGGGFPTGLKWKYAAASVADQKYMLCNADEGDPGAFMDRSILEGDPHSVIEGMIIGGYAIGASQGVIYCRAEYPLAIARLNTAIAQAREQGYLGKHILGIESFSFDLYIKEGAGAFVCGEETALIASIEGKRGMPRKRPPFPAESGLWGMPSNINNVETFANIPWILSQGAAAYAAYGTEKSKGTKVFALTGKVKRGGLVEVPMGVTIRQIIFGPGGGIRDDRAFKAVQLGGPSGGCLPERLCDTPVDYDSLSATGAIMGSGGMVVMDESTCMVDMARFFIDFTRKESCGKCTFCRVGTTRMLEILEKISQGKGEVADLERLEELALQVREASLCGLGQTAPNPVLTMLKYFREEYLMHIEQKKCPAKVCKPLLTYEIDPAKCTGCTLCVKACASEAISGQRKQIHIIAQEKCIKCGACVLKCNFDAIRVS